MSALCVLVPALGRSFVRAVAEYTAHLGQMSQREAQSILGLHQSASPTKEEVAEKARMLVSMNKDAPGITSPYIIERILSAKEALLWNAKLI
ncbi:hypothetical protein NECID01_1735 [Nematocida sp. AWRm77]|nr:hypothetical protein NECID01_1735 [Nematocida sp. AWRm77]